MIKGAHFIFALPILGLAIAGCSHTLTAKATAQTSTASAPSTPKGTLKELGIKDVKVGNGGQFGITQAAKAGDRVYVLYTGKLADGIVFDSNETSGGQALSFTIGDHSVVPGFDKGVVGMKVGGERKVSIPASMGYGDKASGKIPADSDLYFDLKLLDLVPSGQENDVDAINLKAGSGPELKKGDQVTIHYTVSDLTGNKVDSDNGKGFSWKYGSGEVFPTLEVGLQGMKEGGTRLIHVGPAVMMRPQTKQAMMQPASPQIVKVELVKIQPGS